MVGRAVPTGSRNPLLAARRKPGTGAGWRLFNRQGWRVAAGRVTPGCKAVNHLQRSRRCIARPPQAPGPATGVPHGHPLVQSPSGLGDRRAHTKHAPRSCPPTPCTPLTTLLHLSIPRYHCIADELRRLHPVSPPLPPRRRAARTHPDPRCGGLGTPPSLRRSGTAAVTCCSRASKDARFPGRLARASGSPAPRHLERDSPRSPPAARDGGGSPQPLPETPGTKGGSWFSAPQCHTEPGMPMLAQLEKRAAQQATHCPTPGHHQDVTLAA